MLSNLKHMMVFTICMRIIGLFLLSGKPKNEKFLRGLVISTIIWISIFLYLSSSDFIRSSKKNFFDSNNLFRNLIKLKVFFRYNVKIKIRNALRFCVSSLLEGHGSWVMLFFSVSSNFSISPADGTHITAHSQSWNTWIKVSKNQFLKFSHLKTRSSFP